MTLDEWMIEQGLTDVVLARQLKIQRETVWRHRHRGVIPKPDQMKKYHELSGGKVTPNDFHNLHPPTMQRQHDQPFEMAGA